MALTFGGYDLGRHAFVRISRYVAPKVQVSTGTVPGRDGEYIKSITRGPIEFVAFMRLKRSTMAEWPRIRTLYASLFSVKKEQVLELPDEPGLWRFATASIADDVTLPLTAPSEFKVRFTDHRACAFGDTKSLTVPSGSSASAMVYGNIETPVTINASSVIRNSSSEQWGIRVDEGDYAHVALGSGTHTVSIDCDSRTVSVDGTTSILTLDSDWLWLEPGLHTFRNDLGTGDITVQWTERWL